jgi:proteic killer suppression protein
MGLPEAIVRAYRKRMQQIRAAVDERDLYAISALHFRKLKGDLAGQRELSLNDQYRLRVELAKTGPQTKIIILGITK